jgi:hypothetical protein
MVDKDAIEKMSLYELLGGLKAGLALAHNAAEEEEVKDRTGELYDEVVAILETHFKFGVLLEKYQ